ncbi:MAG: transglycosylase SLT domain-containing protein [Minisyncoccia bacterium]
MWWVVLAVCEVLLVTGLITLFVMFQRTLGTATTNALTKPSFFVPKHQLSVGVGRENMSETALSERTERVVEEQKFGILRSPVAVQCAERINALQPIFREAARESGFSQTMLQGMAWIESCGDPRAKSPTGPRGVMQFTEGTGVDAGLVNKEVRKKKVPKGWKYKGKGKKRRKVATGWRTVSYTVVVKDDRLNAKKSIFAAAHYLKRLEADLGGEDLAVFAFHCGRGCVKEMVSLGKKAFGEPVTMPRLFFLNHPSFNSKIYHKIRYHMGRDWSPTYWFRVVAAAELFDLYQTEPAKFKKLARRYRENVNVKGEVPSRMWFWLTKKDLIYKNLRDLNPRDGGGKGLEPLFEEPDYFGFKLRTSGNGPIAEKDLENQELYLQNSPAAHGALLTVAFETRRLHVKLYPKEEFVPLDVTSLVRHLEYQELLKKGKIVNARTAFPTHTSGQVFDVSYLYLPKGERRCLTFILEDLEHYGYLSFIEEVTGSRTFHVTVSPSSRQFFSQVFEDARSEAKARFKK